MAVFFLDLVWLLILQNEWTFAITEFQESILNGNISGIRYLVQNFGFPRPESGGWLFLTPLTARPPYP